MTDARVKDYPDLRKSGPGVTNVNDREYHLALSRRRTTRENTRLKTRVETLERQMEMILASLKGGNHGNQ